MQKSFQGGRINMVKNFMQTRLHNHMEVRPKTGLRHFSTILDIIRQCSAFFNKIRLFFLNSTIFDIIQQYSTLFDNIRHYSTQFDNFRPSNNVEKCCGPQFLLLNYVADVEKCRGPLWGGPIWSFTIYDLQFFFFYQQLCA